MASKADPKAKAKGKEPLCEIFPVKDVFPLFQDRKTKQLPLNDVPYVLRACGLTIYGEEEAKIKAEVEKVDGMGKPVSLSTLQDWMENNQASYTRTHEEAYNALWTLCQEGIIGEVKDKSQTIIIPHLRHLVSEVGDKIKPDTFDKVIKGDNTITSDAINLDDFINYLKK
mmetsp:Transcript_58187/g.123555  ORF Transcript_58187/g.123555 Transcript_58187/m.123555 type:complete len:170 (-) Transcript_58187:176-685(-)